MSVDPTPTTHTRARQRPLSTYERYLRVDELLRLQKEPEERLHPDELTFQVVHQTIELWWKQTAQQLDDAAAHLRASTPAEAARALRRAVAAQSVVMAASRQLEFVAPADFLTIRAGLGDGSGADSPGFRGILRRARELWDAFGVALFQRGVTLLDVYRAPHAHLALFECAEALTDFDEQFHLFRAQHLKLAARSLGPRAIGTGGTPMPTLARTLTDLLFPALWEVRDALLAATAQPDGASAHGEH